MGADEPTIAELVTRAEIAMRDLMVAHSQALQRDGCCSSDTWRGHLCEYHQGFADGIDELLERQHAAWAMMHGEPADE